MDNRERREVAISKQDFAGEKQVDDLLKQAVLTGLLAAMRGHRYDENRTAGQTERHYTTPDRNAASFLLA